MKNTVDTIKIVNAKQVIFYINNGLKPLDIFVGKGGVLVYVFDRKKTVPIFDKWCLRKAPEND